MNYREAWAKELEEGGLPQTRGELYRTHQSISDHDGSICPAGFCCLGVGLKVIGYSPEEFEYISTFNGFAQKKGLYDQIEEHISAAPLQDQLGINDDVENFLADLNDKAKLSFGEIAVLIRLGNAAIAAKHRELCPDNRSPSLHKEF